MQIAGLLGRVTAITHVKHLACHLIHAGNPPSLFYPSYYKYWTCKYGCQFDRKCSLFGTLEGLLVALMSCVEGVEVMGESTLVQQWVCTELSWCVVLSSFQI